VLGARLTEAEINGRHNNRAGPSIFLRVGISGKSRWGEDDLERPRAQELQRQRVSRAAVGRGRGRPGRDEIGERLSLVVQAGEAVRIEGLGGA
jgi:hypothetical protein